MSLAKHACLRASAVGAAHLIAVGYQKDRLNDPEYVRLQSRTLQDFLGDEESCEHITAFRAVLQQGIDETEVRFNDPKEINWNQMQHLISANFSQWLHYTTGDYSEVSQLAGFVKVERMRELAAGLPPTKDELTQFQNASACDELFHHRHICKAHVTAVSSQTGNALYVVGFIDSNFALVDHIGPFVSFEDAEDSMDTFGMTSDWIRADRQIDDDEEVEDDSDEEIAE